MIFQFNKLSHTNKVVKQNAIITINKLLPIVYKKKSKLLFIQKQYT